MTQSPSNETPTTGECEPKQLGAAVRQIVKRLDETFDDRRAREAEERERERAKRERVSSAVSNWEKIKKNVGSRYDGCRLDNFKAVTEEQKAVVARLEDYRRGMRGYVPSGDGLILFGPKGTGKDHLMVAMIYHALRDWMMWEIEWTNGLELYAEVRDAMDTDVSEWELVSKYAKPDILAISDPLPPSGTLTDFQAAYLFRILDARYRNRRPTWITVNVSSRKELEERLGAQNADRLCDGAIALFCDWESYRKVQK